MLELRAEALARTREFFSSLGVLEVDTPVVVNAPVTDVHIHSAEVRFPPQDAPMTNGLTVRPSSAYYLQTSPEFAMKRLLASGSGDIYQICHVVRGLERGRQHNAEFTLVEWYRLGFSLEQLMDETEALARHVLGPAAAAMRSERITYSEAFRTSLGLDPLTVPLADLRTVAREAGLVTSLARAPGAAEQAERDELLEFLMSTKVGPTLGRGALTCVHRYPASQAALARLDERDPRCALRFELYCEGMELANGFHELACATEQRSRFEHDLAERRRRGLPADRMDEFLLGALASGLPDCAGVALGFDRLLMLASGARHIDEVLPFPIERA
jgi:lysyl-tRNA synthetase class 2